jgi:hypothetical protein
MRGSSTSYLPLSAPIDRLGAAHLCAMFNVSDGYLLEISRCVNAR